MKKNVVPSQETQQEAMKIAKATQKPGQTKEQTKLIAQGVEKGIALYKKQQKQKSREADKAKKKASRLKAVQSVEREANDQPQIPANNEENKASNMLPWVLLVASWVGFAAYFFV
ncbi:DUF2956 domain-containing protein [Vibrio maerlii]|uniref:DUF2956 domain-containing protein n=1 Tax=Vibrio maerlii TaxID=2231648 RepID=UPI000E3CB8AD|nr:DUF2956 domain-containing protein [Vibrio maerlii]